MSTDRSARIRELNDIFRKSFIGGKVFITEGVHALGPDFESACVERVQKHRRFADDLTPSFAPAEIRAGRLFCASARLKQWAA